MSEILEPASESLQKTISASGAQAKPGSLAHLRQEPAKTFSIILLASIVVSVLLGYWISRMEEQSRRQRLMEDWMQEVTHWISSPNSKNFTANLSPAFHGRSFGTTQQKSKRSPISSGKGSGGITFANVIETLAQLRG